MSWCSPPRPVTRCGAATSTPGCGGPRRSQPGSTRRRAFTICGTAMWRCSSRPGAPVKAIQHRLGHSSIVMTMDRYGHLLAEVDEDLIAGLEAQLSGG